MAMQLDKELDSGLVCKYHRVLRVRIDYRMKEASIEIASYIDQAARLADKAPAMVFVHNVEGDVVLSGDARQIAYSVLSSEGQIFEGAIEV